MTAHLLRLAALASTLALAGCFGAGKAPEPEFRYVSIATKVSPVLPGECFRKSPPKPEPAGPDNADLVRSIDAFDDRANIVDGLRATCAAALKAHGLGPAEARTK